MTRNLHIATAKGAIQIVNDLSYINQIKAIGINSQEWDRLTGSKPWAAKERPVIERLIKHLIFGMLDMMGVGRFEVPAELVAAIGVSYISPCNYWAFAGWTGSHARAEELGNYDGSRIGPIEGLEKVTQSQLFALICELKSDEHSQLLIRRFSDKTELAMKEPMEAETNEKKTG